MVSPLCQLLDQGLKLPSEALTGFPPRVRACPWGKGGWFGQGMVRSLSNTFREQFGSFLSLKLTQAMNPTVSSNPANSQAFVCRGIEHSLLRVVVRAVWLDSGAGPCCCVFGLVAFHPCCRSCGEEGCVPVQVNRSVSEKHLQEAISFGCLGNWMTPLLTLISLA